MRRRDDEPDGLLEPSLDLRAHTGPCGRGTTRDLNATTCIDISTLRCSGRDGGTGYGRSSYGLVRHIRLAQKHLGESVQCQVWDHPARRKRLPLVEREACTWVRWVGELRGCLRLVVRRTLPCVVRQLWIGGDRSLEEWVLLKGSPAILICHYTRRRPCAARPSSSVVGTVNDGG